MEKRYVNPENNKCRSHLRQHIKPGDTVIVVDGSGMVNARTKEHTSGINFIRYSQSKPSGHELLTVTHINIPFETEYVCIKDVLGYHNNCEIQGFDGEKYYCSLINIIRYDTEYPQTA